MTAIIAKNNLRLAACCPKGADLPVEALIFARARNAKGMNEIFNIAFRLDRVTPLF